MFEQEHPKELKKWTKAQLLEHIEEAYREVDRLVKDLYDREVEADAEFARMLERYEGIPVEEGMAALRKRK